MSEPKHGGPGRGQGRHSLSGSKAGKSPIISGRVTEAQRDKYYRLGGWPWVRLMIDLAELDDVGTPNRG